jgi:innexin
MDFIDYLSRFKITSDVSVQDRADRLNYLYTNMILLLFTTVITLKQYMLKPISCYMNSDPGGTNLLEYVENHCWVQGTFPNEERAPLPDNNEQWDALESKKILYYQWVPFVLVLQCFLFYAPRLLWTFMCYNRTGTDLQHLLRCANDALHSDHETRNKTVVQISATIEEMLFKHREIRNNVQSRMVHRLYNVCNTFVASKRKGTWIVVSYLIIKWLYLANAIGQLFLMQRFLGFGSEYALFGVEVMKNIVSGKDWRITMVFPRVTYCYARVRHVTSLNSVTAQCVLPVNMLNEKIYIFLWFWIVIVAFATLVSIPLWLKRIVMRSSHRRFIKKNLRIGKQYLKKETSLIDKFTRDFLRHDGVFILQMLSINCGDIITSDVVCYLWATFKKHYSDYSFLRSDSCGKLASSNATDEDADLISYNNGPPFISHADTLQKPAAVTPFMQRQPSKSKGVTDEEVA